MGAGPTKAKSISRDRGHLPGPEVWIRPQLRNIALAQGILMILGGLRYSRQGVVRKRVWDTRLLPQIHQPFSRRQGGGLDPFRAVGIDNFPNSSCFYVFLRISGFNLFCGAGQPPWDRHLGVLCFMKDFGCRFAHTVCSEIDVGAR